MESIEASGVTITVQLLILLSVTSLTLSLVLLPRVPTNEPPAHNTLNVCFQRAQTETLDHDYWDLRDKRTERTKHIHPRTRI